MAKNMSTADGGSSALIRFPISGQRVCHLELGDRCLPARLARKATRLLLGNLDVRIGEVHLIEEAVAELVTNAERYAPRPWRLRLYLDDHALWIGVCDGDPGTARPLEDLLRHRQEPSLLEERGRGLFLASAACGGECWVRSELADSDGRGKEILLRFALLRSDTPVATAA